MSCDSPPLSSQTPHAASTIADNRLEASDLQRSRYFRSTFSPSLARRVANGRPHWIFVRIDDSLLARLRTFSRSVTAPSRRASKRSFPRRCVCFLSVSLKDRSSVTSGTSPAGNRRNRLREDVPNSDEARPPPSFIPIRDWQSGDLHRQRDNRARYCYVSLLEIRTNEVVVMPGLEQSPCAGRSIANVNVRTPSITLTSLSGIRAPHGATALLECLQGQRERCPCCS